MYLRYAVLIFVVVTISLDPVAVGACNAVQEGKNATFQCNTHATDFRNNFGMVKGSETLILCFKNKTCHVYQYNKDFEVTIDNTLTWSISLNFGPVTRDESHKFDCANDGIIYDSCELSVYVIPEAPVCQDPKFIEDGTQMYMECTVDNIYPDVYCKFYEQEHEQNFIESATAEKSALRASTRYPGSFVATCELYVVVAGAIEKDYYFMASASPKVPDLSESIEVNGKAMGPIRLESIRFFNPDDNNHKYSVGKGDNLTASIQITGSPPPNVFSLSMIHQGEPTMFTVQRSDYEMSFEDDILGVHLENVGADEGNMSFGKYTLEASNGVTGHIEFNFTIVDAGDNHLSSHKKTLYLLVVVLLILLCGRDKRFHIERPRRRAAKFAHSAYATPYDDNPLMSITQTSVGFRNPLAGTGHQQASIGSQLPPPYSLHPPAAGKTGTVTAAIQSQLEVIDAIAAAQANKPTKDGNLQWG